MHCSVCFLGIDIDACVEPVLSMNESVTHPHNM